MLFIDEFYETEFGKKTTKIEKEQCTYASFYKYWREELAERIIKLFVWEDTYDVKTFKGIEPRQIELRLIINGHCGITKYKNELTAFFGSFYGPTVYFNEWKNYNIWSPVYSGTRKIDKDIVVIDNNSTRLPSISLIHRYAVMLAHTEVSLILALINLRDSGGVPVAATEKQKRSIEQYQDRLFNGKFGVVTDLASLGVSYVGANRNTNQDILGIMESREKLIKSFYSDIGIRSAFEKRNNTVQAEVEADTSLLLFNISDMLATRKQACEEVNNMFGTNWSVHVAEEIDYGAENQRLQFSNSTAIHSITADGSTSVLGVEEGGKANVES